MAAIFKAFLKAQKVFKSFHDITSCRSKQLMTFNEKMKCICVSMLIDIESLTKYYAHNEYCEFLCQPKSYQSSASMEVEKLATKSCKSCTNCRGTLA